MVETKRLSSMIFYGPPGIGKTVLRKQFLVALTINLTIKCSYKFKKDMQMVVEEAKMSGQVILLLDEIHRLDKAKQDFLLPHLENGKIVLIGATTSNPYHAINPAIRSRAQIFELYSLDHDDVRLNQ